MYNENSGWPHQNRKVYIRAASGHIISIKSDTLETSTLYVPIMWPQQERTRGQIKDLFHYPNYLLFSSEVFEIWQNCYIPNRIR